MDDNSENDVKMILLGDCGVGKTNIISRYIKDEFKNEPITIGTNYKSKDIEINGTKLKIYFWDTAGQERYKSVTKMSLQNTQILVLCYSITDRKSFENLEFWFDMAIKVTGTNIVLGVAGNKSDLFEIEEVSEEEGENFAKEHNGIFRMISAKISKKEIDLFFNQLFKRYLEMKNGDETFSEIKIDLKRKTTNRNKTKCC